MGARRRADRGPDSGAPVMSTDPLLAPGAYARILDEELEELIALSPDLLQTLRELEEEEEPGQFSLLLGQMFLQALRQCSSATRATLLNRLIELLGAQEGLDYLVRKKILHPPQDAYVSLPARSNRPAVAFASHSTEYKFSIHRCGRNANPGARAGEGNAKRRPIGPARVFHQTLGITTLDARAAGTHQASSTRTSDNDLLHGRL